MTPEKKIVDLLNKVSGTSGKRDKETILSELEGFSEYDKGIFKSVVSYTYDLVKYTYGIKSFTIADGDGGDIGWSGVVELLNKLDSGMGRGEATEAIMNICDELTVDAKDLMVRALNRDLRIGVGPRTLSKVLGKDVISVTPYMRCTSFSDKAMGKIKLPCIAQIKADGRFVNIIVRSNSVSLISRNGEDCSHLISQDIADRLIAVTPNTVIHGEILVSDQRGGVLERSEGNGYLNSDDVDTDLVIFDSWDIVDFDTFFDGKASPKYEERLEKLNHALALSGLDGDVFGVIPTRICNTIEEVEGFFDDVRQLGYEGLILKNSKGLWKNGTSSDQVKVKVEVEGEVVVTGMTEGKGKYVGMTGALTTESSCGSVKTSVAGLSDAQRRDFWKDPSTIVGKVITVRYNDVTYNETTKSHALYLPRLVEVRTDKDTPDDRETLVDMMQNATEIFDILKKM